MNINERVDLLIQLGEYFVMNDESLQSAKQKAKAGNGWFSIEFIDLALENITKNFLQKNLLEAWIKNYDLKGEPPAVKKIGIVMAGKDDALLAGAGQRRAEIDHPHFVDRRLRVPRLLDGGQTRGAQLILDVLAGLFDRRRARRPRSDRDELTQILPRAPGIELRGHLRCERQ